MHVVFARTGQAEIEEFDTKLAEILIGAGFQPDVAGFEIAMDEAPGTGGGQANGDLPGDADGLCDRDKKRCQEPLISFIICVASARLLTGRQDACTTITAIQDATEAMAG
jgi:hypothetical protein